MSLPDNQVTLDILQLLYNRTNDNPSSLGVDRAIIQATLKIPQQQMDDAVSFLEANGLVTISISGGTKWTFAKITGDGLDVVENKERYAEKYAFTQTTSSQIQEQGHKIPKVQPKINFSELLTSAFRQASNQVLGAKMPNSDKSKIERQLRELQKELSKAEKADLGSIKKDWESLKKNSSFVCPIIAPAILETLKLIFELP